MYLLNLLTIYYPRACEEKPYWRGMVSTVDLLIKMGCFVKKKNKVSILKAADLDKLWQGGQQYCSFPISEDSLACVTIFVRKTVINVMRCQNYSFCLLQYTLARLQTGLNLGLNCNTLWHGKNIVSALAIVTKGGY
jgi:hypothetical protein